MSTEKSSNLSDLSSKLTDKEQKTLSEKMHFLRNQGLSDFELTKKIEKMRYEIIVSRNKPSEIENNSFIVTQPRLLTLPSIVPVVPEPHISPLSNWIAKSAIFAPRKRGFRQHTGLNWVELISPRGIKIFYNGPELDMTDHTLYLHLIKLAEGKAPNERIYINRYQLLKRCGYKKIGKSAYDWLTSAFDRLMQANIKIIVENSILEDNNKIFTTEVNSTDIVKYKKVKRVTLTLKIMGELIELHDTGNYCYSIPPTSLGLFAGQLYGYNDLIKRNKIQSGKRGDLAAWLQSYICAEHSGIHQPVYVETFWRHSASKTRLNDFAARLQEAFDNCQSAGVIQSWKLMENEEKKMISWVR